MRYSLWLLLNLIALQYFLVKATVHPRAKAAKPVKAPSPPEGNATFLSGTTWCVARPGVPENDLQVALDWACGPGKADCRPIQKGGPCFEPNTLMSHASYAFNAYYQQNGKSDNACFFGGTAVLTPRNPSYAKCAFATSKSLKSSSATWLESIGGSIWWKINVVLLLLYLGRR